MALPLLIGLFCLLAVIGFFATGHPFKFALGGIVALIALAFVLIAVIVVWTMAAPCSAPFADHSSVYCQNQAQLNQSIGGNNNTASISPASVPKLTLQQILAKGTPAATATIDQNSLISTSAKSTIAGTFSNLSGGIGLFIATQPLPTEITPNGSAPAGVVFSDGSDHGGGVEMSTTGDNSSGTYSDTLWKALPNGSYYVGIYQTSTIYNSSGFQGYNTSYLLTSGTLNIQSPSTTS